jgi:hypothetical protein
MAVSFHIFANSSARNFILGKMRIPLDNGQKQPMMWPKVGQSGQQ